MTTAPHPDPFEEFQRDLNTEGDTSTPITEEEILAAVAWLEAQPSAQRGVI